MGQLLSPPLRLRACGELACFTRPELKVERVSYPVITPSAARGLIESILWKPAIAWRIDRIQVLKPIRFASFRRNEVNSKAPRPSTKLIANGGRPPVLFADEDRAQRNTVALSGVDYIIEARFRMTDKAGPEDNMNKFVEMFRRRVSKGQHFQQPYFGCREFPARIDSVPDDIKAPIDDCRELGLMLWDIAYSETGNMPIFFAAKLNNGELVVPESPEAALATLTGGAL